MEIPEELKIQIDEVKKDLVINKRFVSIDQYKYTDEAFKYILKLIDDQESILFINDKNRIYTLGQYYGGDTFKENLHYFSKILSINENDEIINEIESKINSSSIALKGINHVNINFDNNKYDTITIDYDLKKAVNTDGVNINGNTYRLGVDNNQINLYEYNKPSIICNIIPIEYNSNIEKIDIDFTTNGSIDFDEWTLFNVKIENGELINIDKENKIISIKPIKNTNTKLTITCNDGIIDDNQVFEFNQTWEYRISYSLIEPSINNFYELDYYLTHDDSINNELTINQNTNQYVYLCCPIKYIPNFIDKSTNLQGAWHYSHTIYIDDNETLKYNIFMTDNSGLGNITWIING